MCDLVQYTKEGYPTTFTITVVEPYKRWEFDMDLRKALAR